MSFEVEGKLHKVFDTESKTDSFQAREFVIEIGQGNYPQFIKFQLTQDRCGLIDAFQPGQVIKVYFDLRGREWNEKYFTNLNAWRIMEAESSPKPQPQEASPASSDSFPTANDEMQLDNMDDDLPF
ncbi:MAG: DUF3127 domain-containing protein [Bacteroidia bacterium]|nr:DUF3127 domain-containing protein [Bacteroidia bacterium]